jgi:hypothetical protein
MTTATVHAPSEEPPRTMWWRLGGLMLLLITLRVPVITHQIPAQDEDYFAVPGYTILREGIPRIPYMPSRNPQGAFYGADRLLFTLPPAYFYWQAGWYAVFGPSTAVARWASLVAGLAALPCLYLLGVRLTGNRRAAWWGTLLYALSRPFMFPCIIARPDMLCGALGFAALLLVERWSQAPRPNRLIAAGVVLGLAFLTHPFALIFALQCGVWVILTPGSIPRRIGRGAALVAVTCGVFALWGLLIAMAPDLFRKQFFNNVLGQAGPGLLSRFVWPFDALRTQWPIGWELMGTWQGSLMGAGLLGMGVVLGWRWMGRRPHETDSTRSIERTLLLWLLTISALYIMIACQGRHPTKGYWCYTAGLMFLCVGWWLETLAATLSEGLHAWWPNECWRRRVMGFGVLGCGLMLMVPGGGLRATYESVRHWGQAPYHAPTFTKTLMTEVPRDARLVVDPGYIFDFYRDGRDVTLGLVYGFFFDVTGTPYDYVIGGPYSIRDGVPERLGAVFVRDYGLAGNDFTCMARLYRRPTGEGTTEDVEEREGKTGTTKHTK